MDKYEFEQLINNDPKYIHLDYTILFNDFWEEEFVIRNFRFFDSYIFLTRSKFEWTLDIFRKLPNLDVRLIQLNKSILWDIDSLTEFECRLFFGKINKNIRVLTRTLEESPQKNKFRINHVKRK